MEISLRCEALIWELGKAIGKAISLKCPNAIRPFSSMILKCSSPIPAPACPQPSRSISALFRQVVHNLSISPNSKTPSISLDFTNFSLGTDPPAPGLPKFGMRQSEPAEAHAPCPDSSQVLPNQARPTPKSGLLPQLNFVKHPRIKCGSTDAAIFD